jgi:hypothetical protein
LGLAQVATSGRNTGVKLLFPETRETGMAARLGVDKSELDFLKAADIVCEHEMRLLKRAT